MRFGKTYSALCVLAYFNDLYRFNGFRHTFTVINMYCLPVPVGQIHAFYSFYSYWFIHVNMSRMSTTIDRELYK